MRVTRALQAAGALVLINAVTGVGLASAMHDSRQSTTAALQSGFPAGLTVSVGYADNVRASGFFPTPWASDSGVTFEGCSGSCSFDGGAVKLTNTTDSTITVNSLQVSLSTCVFNLWPSNLSLAAGATLIYAQTASGADNGCTNNGHFDTSDIGPNGVGWSGNCSNSGVIPEIDVTANGAAQAFNDSNQVLNTGGIDTASCPSGTNESEPWTQINGTLTPAQLLGAFNPSAPQLVPCHIVAPVECATGNFWHTFNEIAIPGRGVPLELSLTYNSADAAQNSPLGFGWSFNYGAHLEIDPSSGDVTVVQENGSTVPFTNSAGSYQPPDYAAASLVHNSDGTYTFTRRHGGWSFTFSSSGTLLSIADRNGYTTTLTYSGGQLQSVTDPANRQLTFSYGANGDIQLVTDPAQRTVQFGYNAAGELTSIQDTNNGLSNFTYDSSHRLLTMTDPRQDGAWTNHYDSAGRVDYQTDPLTRKTSFSYLAGTTTITDPNLNVTREHFSNFEPVAVTEGYGTSYEATWKYGYDPTTLGRTLITDPNGHLTSAQYDSDGNQTDFKDGLNRETTVTYNNFDEPLIVKDPSLVQTTRSYDAHGNVLSVSRPLGTSGTVQAVSFTYGDANHPGDITAVTDANGKTKQIGHDGYGDVSSVTDALGDEATYFYNSLGQLTSSVSPRGNATGADPAQYTTTYLYNGLGLVTQIKDPLGDLFKRIYDGDGNLTSFTDADNNPTTYIYDADNELTKVTRADGTFLQYGYDGDGNQTSQTDANNQPTGYGYDPLDRLVSITDPLNRTTKYGHDGAGNLTSVTDPSNRSTTYGYDAADQLKTISYSDGTTPSVGFTYTDNGLRQTMADGSGTTSYFYDSLNRLTSQQNGAGQTVLYSYDLDNHLTDITYPGNHDVTRVYDEAGRLRKITDWLNHTTAITPDADGNTTTLAYPNGLTSTTAFDNADRLSSITDKNVGGTTIASFTYTRDGNGQLKSTTPTGTGQGSNETYGYNNLNQLTSVNTATYSYDPANNVTQLATGPTLGYDIANEATKFTPQGGSPTTLPYDAQGNRLSGVNGDSYAYDQANRLISASAGMKSLAAGQISSLGLKSDGTVWAWGSDADGELGDGGGPDSTTPVQVSNLVGVTAVAAGSDHDLALKSDGTVWAWGGNVDGQLGNGTTTRSNVPVQVSSLSGVVAVGAGSGWSLALKSNGTVWAWGINSDGELGNGKTKNSSLPVQVSNVTGVIAIASGQFHGLALKSDGTVWAWGYNAFGQIGNNSTRDALTPVQVFSGASSIAAGAGHSVALKPDGTVWAWGDNSHGQLGNGTTSSSSVPTQSTTITGATKVSAGFEHTFALKNDGSLWTWGGNGSGELGNGGTTDSPSAVQVSLSGVIFLARGSVAKTTLVLSGTTAWAWGDGLSGQLGNGTTSNSSVPVKVSATSSTTFAYDGDGLRVAATTGSSVKHFAWDISGGLPLLLTDASTSYIYDDAGNPVEQIDGTGTPLYYQHDQLGSTRLLTDQSGATAATYTYDVYGNLTSNTGSADTPLRWAGQYQDASTGLYYLRGRYYDPVSSQFLTRDPFVRETQAPYSYVDADPLDASDPSGMGWGAYLRCMGDCLFKTLYYDTRFASCRACFEHFLDSTSGGVLPGPGDYVVLIGCILLSPKCAHAVKACHYGECKDRLTNGESAPKPIIIPVPGRPTLSPWPMPIPGLGISITPTFQFTPAEQCG